MKSTAGNTNSIPFTAWRRFIWAGARGLVMATQGLAQAPGQAIPAIRGGCFFEHPVEAIAESPTAAQEAIALRAAVNGANLSNIPEVEEVLEAFIAENPSSVWTPSLRANLGRHYCTEGYWTKALEQSEHAWDDTKQDKTGPGKRVGDYALVSWTRLLVELGRLDELQVVFAEAGPRRLDGGPLSQKFVRTKEMYRILRSRPQASYRCGWPVSEQAGGRNSGPRT